LSKLLSLGRLRECVPVWFLGQAGSY
jgi:hypothetical protein